MICPSCTIALAPIGAAYLTRSDAGDLTRRRAMHDHFRSGLCGLPVCSDVAASSVLRRIHIYPGPAPSRNASPAHLLKKVSRIVKQMLVKTCFKRYALHCGRQWSHGHRLGSRVPQGFSRGSRILSY